ncbi:kunitz-type protease inhibitor PcKuz1-like [Xenia sp. Carnegie-2017]|uniref:kunitz-type protease inhibitor PcKuz1-like n=1 Tax=Xenia sp. Carnegie-2017 TaxID=2897299 RepID=UPI001F03330C|nr:kunitz-type protease inhibitor PcKuz1-like [Xenia sp. Carnegie-2017]
MAFSRLMFCLAAIFLALLCACSQAERNVHHVDKDRACLELKKTGPCRAAFQRYYYNSEDNECEKFIYGGCQENGNNFKTKRECEELCVRGNSRKSESK